MIYGEGKVCPEYNVTFGQKAQQLVYFHTKPTINILVVHVLQYHNVIPK